MPAYYQRRSNALGWLMFFGIGGLVFAGLIGGLFYLKGEQEKLEQSQREAAGSTGKRNPIVMINEYLAKDYKSKGQGFQRVDRTEPKQVQSKAKNREVTLVRVRHRAAEDPDTVEPNDQVFVIDGNKITVAKFADWDRMKQEFGIDDEP